MKKTAALALFLLLGLMLAGRTAVVEQTESKPDEPQLKKEIITVKYVRASQARNLLKSYLSRYGEIGFDDSLKILTIQDSAVIVDKIMDALKKIDIKPIDLLFTVDMIQGSMDPNDMDGELRSDPLIRDLQKVLNFKAYRKLGSSLVRVQENAHSEQMLGSGDLDFKMRLLATYIKEEREDTFQVRLELAHQRLGLSEGVYKQTNVPLFSTTLTMKSGERTIVGVSKLDGGDNAMILILSGKVIK